MGNSRLSLALAALVFFALLEVRAEVEIYKKLKNEFPSLACEADFYFMSCFKITEKECLKKTKSFLGTCIEKDRLSRTPASEESRAFRVGNCVGTKFETIFESLKGSKIECKDMRNWQ